MNKIMTMFFLLFIFNFYYFLGEFALSKFNYKKEDRFGVKILLGFLLTFSIGFLVGLPSQLFFVSWDVYALLMFITYFGILLFLGFYYRQRIICNIRKIRTDWKSALLLHFKEFWLIYVLVIIFSVLSMANQEAFLYMNYDDHFYIGKMVNEIGTPALGNEDYFSGMLLPNLSFSLERIANTYEITYAFFGNLFNISMPFFCRVTMTIQNYFIVFLCYKSFAELLLNRKISQYSVIMFAVFLIPHGFLMNSPNMPFQLNIKSFDAWQLQTAIFYGSSVVRAIALPSLLLFGKNLIVKMDFRRLILVILISFSFLSFSTIFFQLSVLLFIMFVITKLVYLIYKSVLKRNKFWLLYLPCLIVVFFILYKAHDYNWLLLFDVETISNYQNVYGDFYSAYIESDILMKIAPIILLISLFVFKKMEDRLLLIIVAGLVVFLKFNFFYKLIFTTAMGYHFVTLRIAAAVQYFILFLVGLLIVKLFSLFKSNLKVLPIASGLFIILNISFITYYFEEVKSYDYLGSGMVKDGYDFKRILSNDEMMPEVAVKIGEYFNTLPYGNYTLFVQNILPYKDTTIDFSNFNAVSNRIELCARNACGEISDQDREILNATLANSTTFDQIREIVLKYKIQYVLVANEELVSNLDSSIDVVYSFSFDNIKYDLLKMY